MLETEEVDDDYFTPKSSTSLANIFGNSSEVDQKTGNASLKYTPPPPNQVKMPSEDTKVTQCVFACAPLGYEWTNDVYKSRGRVGFAILKIVKTGVHNIVLYDSNKITLSYASINCSFELTIKGNYFTYYDDSQKHWSLYATDNEISKISEILKTIGACIKTINYEDKGPPDPLSSNDTKSAIKTEVSKVDKESDTDSSINRKTKASILNRMASMGQSILPSNVIPREVTSDSSDTNDSNNYHMPVRHKTIKSVIKRVNPEKQSSSDSQLGHQTISLNKTEAVENIQIYTPVTTQLLPAGSSLITNPDKNFGNDFNFLMTEQRINNSELRINVNRMSDKVDLILDKIRDLNFSDNESRHTSQQIDIAYKLLAEYENKIKTYEEIIKSKKSNTCDTEQVHFLQNKILELQLDNEVKNKEILNLRQEIKDITSKHAQLIETKTQYIDDMLHNIENLEAALASKNEEIEVIAKQTQNERVKDPINNDEFASKVKNIMNDAYQGIAANFENNEVYSAETIKSTVAKVIKQVTIKCLKES